VFFDGTGGNRDNDIKIGDGSLTNIPKLASLYAKSGYIALYEPGIGTREYMDGRTFSDEQVRQIRAAAQLGDTDKKADFYETLELAFALEAKDITLSMMSRIERTLIDIRASDPAASILIDVYGYSRGAAVARDFINTFNTEFAHDELIDIDFVGLYDTVASVGTRGDFDWGLNLNLCLKSARAVVQLTAADERRYNFPLDSLITQRKRLCANMR
jgi:uncharacterized protein (DUF2235 family)